MNLCSAYRTPRGRNTLSPNVRRQWLDSRRIQGHRRSRDAYVSEEVEAFAMKVKIIRKVPTVSSPNDFGKSRV